MPDFFILSVEDDPNDLVSLKWAFAKAGLRGAVHFVRSCKGAMDYLIGVPPFDERSKHPFPNLILVDLKMPETDGFQLLAWLRAQPFATNGLKIAVLTGSCRQQDFERGHALGADFCLNKSTDLQELVAAIKSMVAGSTG
jgi:CheY-like chemotaxis protein